MFDLIGLIFMLGLIGLLLRFVFNKHKAIQGDAEPSSDRVALDKKNIGAMLIDVEANKVIGVENK